MRNSNKSGKKPIEEMGAMRPRKGKLERLRPKSTKHKKAKGAKAGVGTDKEETLRKTGIDILGDAPWGTHFCLFYHTKQDLIDILVPYFKAGLENNEFCVWVTSEPLNADDAKRSLSRAVKNLDGYIKKGQIEILDYSDWYTKTGAFEADKVLQGWVDKHDEAVKRDFDGLRLTGNTLWLEKKDWGKFTDYEAVVNGVIGKYKMLAICTYSLERCGASEILDVEHNHQFSLIKWKGDWKILESSDRNQVEARLAEQTMISEALEHSKKEWESTFNAMSDWVVMVDVGGRILRTNRIGEEFTGVPLDEIIWQSCCRLVHGSDKHIPGCPLLKMVETSQRASAELQVPDTDRWLMVTVDPVTDEGGKLVGAVHIVRDITERKRAEEALQESEEKYRNLVNNSNDIVCTADESGNWIFLSPAVKGILGYDPTEMNGRSAFDFMFPEDIAPTREAHESIVREGKQVWEYENRYINKNGSIVTLAWNVVAFRDKEGKIIGTQGVGRDITERKRAEEALRESEGKYKTLTESSITGIFIHQDGRYAFVNDRFTEIHSYKAEELLGKEYLSLVHPDEREITAQIVSKRLAGKEITQRREMRRLSKDGRTIWCEMMASRIEYRGRPAIMGNIIDITERKRAAEEVERLAKFPSENPNPVLRISSNGLILYSNKAALPLLKVWGCRRKEQLLSGRWYQYAADALGSGGNQQAEVKCGKRTFSLTFAPVADSNYVNVYALDITKRKRVEKKLLEDKKQLRSLASELSLTEERERRRVAEGLHDSIIQPLVFLDIKLDSLKKSTKQHGLIDSLDEMRTTIGELIEMTRGFTFDLSSSVVYELGIEAAIEEWLTTNVREKYAIATVFEDDGQSKPLDDDMRAFLFKAVRELLINVVKHAGAGSVKVSVARDEDKIKICVEDDGAGFEYLKKKVGLSNSSGYGLFSIRERLHYLGGSFDIESKLGHGTRVALTAPLKCDS